ncbi:MAG: ADP-ribosylglycohydrolase family protein [Spirochaetaceae bacterium]|nr:MAG: ADP-ribosylglycohydrolase family protein [Spirochaetaceae bacterium]
MIDTNEYRTRVYAGVLGKTIGVYLGRPFEGWEKDRLEERFGMVSGYVHEELGKPLVVADDDLSGTFTFIRALEDSGLYADTPAEAVGDAWLNYVIEGKSIFWWGGMAHSTEHTAFLRLLQGVRAPESGSIALNGQTVAEQIGAQIFIDAFGMVCPGDPELAAKLARAAASVGHDGEAVHAAVVVAALCAEAFVESNMERLLDRAIAVIPADSLIAQVHRDVREWARGDGDWRVTFDRINERYGYHIYGGNCHVVPNHALMVLAWAYAGDDFYEAQRIVNTAGWDTDCNAANVGSVMGIALGLDAIDARYPFREPVADRLYIPTAEGTFSVSDCLIVARHIASIGERVMGVDTPAGAPAPGWHHFGEPGAVHGWQPEANSFAARGRARVENVVHPDRSGERCLRVKAQVGAGIAPAISTPILARPTPGYSVDGCPRIMPGTTVTFALSRCSGPARLVPFVRYLPCGGSQELTVDGADVALDQNPGELLFAVPTDLNGTIFDLGLRIDADRLGEVEFHVASVDLGGRVVLDLPAGPRLSDKRLVGWLHDCDMIRESFSDDPQPQAHLGHNKGRGLCVTGTRDWRDSSIAAVIGIHGGDACGLVVRYQGRERYYAAIIDRDGIRVIRREYGADHLLATTIVDGSAYEPRRFALRATGDTIELTHDDTVVLSLHDSTYAVGGAGLLIEQALIDVRDLRIEADLVPGRYR